MVASGTAAGVVGDASVRDENAVSGISNNVISKKLMVLHTIKANFVHNAIGGSTRNEHGREEHKSSPCGCSDDLALVWLVLKHLARPDQNTKSI